MLEVSESGIKPEINLPLTVEQGEMPKLGEKLPIISEHRLNAEIIENEDIKPQGLKTRRELQEDEKGCCGKSGVCSDCIAKTQILKREGRRGFYMNGKLFEKKEK